MITSDRTGNHSPQAADVTTSLQIRNATSVAAPGEPLVVELHGNVCRDTVPFALAHIEPLVDAAGSIELDLAAVQLVDARGLSMLASLDRELTYRGGHLRLRNPQPFVREVLVVAKFDHMIHDPGADEG